MQGQKAPPDIIGKTKFRHDIHSEPGIEIPGWVSDALSAGHKYIQPCLANKEFPVKAWPDLVNRIRTEVTALHNRWDPITNKPVEIIREKYCPWPIPIIPREFDEVEECLADGIEEGIREGWEELIRQVHSVPEPTELEQPWMLKFGKAFDWLTENNYLVKQTDKNLGTVIVSVDWYRQQVIEFLDIPLFHPVTDEYTLHVLLMQVNGLAMGVPAAPDIANLFAAHYERNKFGSAFSDNVLLFKRYINDIICIFQAPSRAYAEWLLDECVKYPGLKVNWDVSDTTGIFLDIEMWKGKGSNRIMYKPYRKPFNNFERLPFISGHADALLKAAFKSEIYRMATLSWDEQTYANELVWLTDLYSKRGYPPAVLKGWIKETKTKAYKRRLKVNENETPVLNHTDGTVGVWPLKSIMNPVWEYLSMSKISTRMHDTWMAHRYSSEMVPYFEKRLLAALKRPENLGDVSNRHNKKVLGIDKNVDVVTLGQPVLGLWDNYDIGESSPDSSDNLSDSEISMDVD
ncbi:hypothetical protein FRC17_004774 [Serendipita sp. 399]|nr:hypothetical protein FRC17_004774 [Serendipita sp. 399]